MKSLGASRRAFAPAAILALCAAVAFPTAASADLSGDVLTIFAASEFASGRFDVSIEDGEWVGDTYIWELDAPVEIVDGDVVVATVEEGTRIEYVADPIVNLNFSVQAATEDTAFTISSALLSFDPIANPVARATAGITVTDGVDGTGALLTGQTAGGFSYLSQYNGFVPGGTTFAELIPQVEAAPGGSATESDDEPDVGFTSIPGPVSDMSTQFSFTLSANDVASGTSLFVVVPEPTGLLLLVAGLGIIRRR